MAKAKPGTLNYSQGSVGGASHLATELFKSMSGTNIVHIPYKGNAPAITALVSGEVQLLMTDFGITPPKAMLGMLKTDPKVTITVENIFGIPLT